jgi:integral membrane protein (TIGR01906 family)
VALKDADASWIRVASRMLQVLLPVVLVLTSIRLILFTAKAWTKIEYQLPGFPADPYGFTLEDRVYWSSLDIEYLLSDAGLEYFDDLLFEDGTPMHNQRELRHMEDVKRLIHAAWVVWGVGLALVFLLVAALWRAEAFEAALYGLQRGSSWTLIGVALVAVGVVFAFGVLFVGFHRIFFEGTTWIFPTSDTFIRLYPERFWRDVFALLAVMTLAMAVIIYLAARWLLHWAGSVDKRG